MPLIQILYALLAIWLAAYGLNSLALTVASLVRREQEPDARVPWSDWPCVTVQLPVYNERHVVERLIDAAAALDYPADALEVQVLDDSTDETWALAQRAVSRHLRQGTNIRLLHRHTRDGFKAGALAHALTEAHGEYIAVFDADFLPPRDFLRRVIPHFAGEDVGCVQGRWDHLNRDYSCLTRAQALGVDAHFGVEQLARSRSGLFLNFNGSGGVWRRDCIEAAGGWQVDTLTEDLDLSYRAQLAGWRILYLPQVLVPGELPPQFDALRRQQARWAQGSIQVARKVLPDLLCSRRPLSVKLEGALHLTGYLVHPLLLMTLLLSVPVLLGAKPLALPVPYFLLGTIGPPLMCVAAQARGGTWARLREAPLLLLIGVGLALNNTQAIVRGFGRSKEEFRRTPKFALSRGTAAWRSSQYALPSSGLVPWELLLSALAAIAAARAWDVGLPSLALWLGLYALAFSTVAGLSLVQADPSTFWGPARRAPARVSKAFRNLSKLLSP